MTQTTEQKKLSTFVFHFSYSFYHLPLKSLNISSNQGKKIISTSPEIIATKAYIQYLQIM